MSKLQLQKAWISWSLRFVTLGTKFHGQLLSKHSLYTSEPWIIENWIKFQRNAVIGYHITSLFAKLPICAVLYFMCFFSLCTQFCFLLLHNSVWYFSFVLLNFCNLSCSSFFQTPPILVAKYISMKVTRVRGVAEDDLLVSCLPDRDEKLSR